MDRSMPITTTKNGNRKGNNKKRLGGYRMSYFTYNISHDLLVTKIK
jgi:hypothetical protein